MSALAASGNCARMVPRSPRKGPAAGLLIRDSFIVGLATLERVAKVV